MADPGKSIGLRNLTWFPLKKDDETGVEYEEGIKLGRAIKATLSPQAATAILDSDDSVEEEFTLMTGIDLTIDSSQIDDSVRAKLFGHKLDEKGGLLYKNTDEPTQGALAFRSLLTGKSAAGKDRFVYIVLYKGSFAEFEETFETIKKGTITFQIHSGVKGSFIPRDNDGAMKYTVREDNASANATMLGNWFVKPQESQDTPVVP